MSTTICRSNCESVWTCFLGGGSGVLWTAVLMSRSICRNSEFQVSIREMDEQLFKTILLNCIRQVHGQVGAGYLLDVLKFDATSLSGVIRVHTRYHFMSVVVSFSGAHCTTGVGGRHQWYYSSFCLSCLSPDSEAVAIRSALAITGTYDGAPCRIRTLGHSSSLLSVMNSSRDFSFSS